MMPNEILEVGKHYRLARAGFETRLVGMFMRLGKMSKGKFSENVLDKNGEMKTSNMTLYHLHLNDENLAKRIMDDFDFDMCKKDNDFEIHIATWQSGKGWIVDHTVLRKIMIEIAHTYEDQPCINCDVYKEKIVEMGKDHWVMNKTCQDCVSGKYWPNFTMEIEEE